MIIIRIRRRRSRQAPLESVWPDRIQVLSDGQTARLSVRLSAYPSVRPPVCSYARPPVRPSVLLSVRTPVRLSVRPSVRVSDNPLKLIQPAVPPGARDGEPPSS